MLRNSFLALACTLALNGSVWADTPVGPGATGVGGTGPNAADARVRDREGGGAPPKRQDGMPVDQADMNVRANPSTGAATRDERTGPEGAGSTSGSGASGKGSAVQKQRKEDED
jgi:hypothetical protein